MTLLEQTQPEFRSIIGKRVEFVQFGRKQQGILEFAGINELHGQFQITVDRTPIWPINPKSLKLVI